MIQRCSENRDLNQARSKPDTVDRPVRNAVLLKDVWLGPNSILTQIRYTFAMLCSNNLNFVRYVDKIALKTKGA